MPTNVENIDRDDISEWVDSVRRNPVPIGGRTEPLPNMLRHNDILRTCKYYDASKKLAKSVALEVKKKFPKVPAEAQVPQRPKRLKGEKKIEYEKKEKAALRALHKFQKNKESYSTYLMNKKMEEDTTLASSFGQISFENMQTTRSGRRFLRRYNMLIDGLQYLRLKAGAFATKAEESSVQDARTLGEFGRLQQSIWDFQKSIISLDNTGPGGALPVTSESGIWARIKQLSESTEDMVPSQKILAPTFQYQMNKFLYFDSIHKSCALVREKEERVDLLKGLKRPSQLFNKIMKRQKAGVGTTTTSLLEVNEEGGKLLHTNAKSKATKKKKQHKKKNQKDASEGKKGFGQESSLKAIKETEYMPSFERADDRAIEKAKEMESLCLEKWTSKVSFKSAIGESTSNLAVLKRTFYSNIDMNCNMCVGFVANELNPDREFIQSSSGSMSSALAYCQKKKTKLEQTRCTMTMYLIIENSMLLSGARKYKSLSRSRPSSMYLQDLFHKNPSFAMYATPKNPLTGHRWTPFEIASGVCRRTMGSCEKAVFDESEIIGDSAALSTTEAERKGEEKEEAKDKEVLKEIQKSPSDFDPVKLEKNANDAQESQMQEACSRFGVLKEKYTSYKKQVKESRGNKICYICSKYVTSLKLQHGMHLKKDGKSLSSDTGGGGIYPNKHIKYADAKKGVCSKKFFDKETDTLKTAEAKCGGNLFSSVKGLNLNTGTSLIETLGSPLLGALAVQSAGVLEPAKQAAMEKLKRTFSTFKSGPVTCGASSFPLKNLVTMEQNMNCIDKQIGESIVSEFGQNTCQKALGVVNQRIEQRLRIVAASLGTPVPKSLEIPDRLHLYRALRTEAYDASGNVQVGKADEKVLAGVLPADLGHSVCVDIGMCSTKQDERMAKYWSSQGMEGSDYAHAVGQILPPGFSARSGEKSENKKSVSATEGIASSAPKEEQGSTSSF